MRVFSPLSILSIHGPIPVAFTCTGADRSPALEWAEVPPGATMLTPILTWTTFWDLPASVPGLGEGEPAARHGATEGVTSNRTAGYHGPCPPAGTHRYVFTLYAVDGKLGLPVSATVEELRRALQGRVLAQADVMGTFAR